MPRKTTLKQILGDHRSLWDHPLTRPAARENFQKVLDCRTLALGAEVYASDNGERKSFPHTCKSRACPSCGQRATLAWQREFAAGLPDIPFAGVNLTMHGDFWPIFQRNRRLLDDLPAIGAGVLEDWTEKNYGARVMVLVVRHTFGGYLNFNAHLHILVSTVDLHKSGRKLVSDIRFPKDAIVKAWRHALLEYLTMALEAGQLSDERSRRELMKLFEIHHDRLWFGWVKYCTSKDAFLRYISRYLRRPPVAEYRLLSSNSHMVSFLAKDTKQNRRVETNCATHDFITRLADQVPDRYRHGVRYFGLLAPRCGQKSYAVFWALLGQRKPPRLKRFRWASSVHFAFKWNPLLDSEGRRMYWLGRISPARDPASNRT
jgi:hypothetical protein